MVRLAHQHPSALGGALACWLRVLLSTSLERYAPGDTMGDVPVGAKVERTGQRSTLRAIAVLASTALPLVALGSVAYASYVKARRAALTTREYRHVGALASQLQARVDGLREVLRAGVRRPDRQTCRASEIRPLRCDAARPPVSPLLPASTSEATVVRTHLRRDPEGVALRLCVAGVNAEYGTARSCGST